MEFQKAWHYDLKYMKTKELGWKENHGIQNIGTEDSKGNITTEKKYWKFRRINLQSSTISLINQKT